MPEEIDMSQKQLSILEAKSEDGFYYGFVFLPWYGREQQVRLRFSLDTDQVEPTIQQWTAIESFLHEKGQIFSLLENQLFVYYRETRIEAQSYYEEGYFIEYYPPIACKNELDKLVSIDSIVVDYFDRKSSSYIAAIIDCTWDRELGVGVKFVDNIVNEIGVQDIVL
jgi:hypothetical protein